MEHLVRHGACVCGGKVDVYCFSAVIVCTTTLSRICCALRICIGAGMQHNLNIGQQLLDCLSPTNGQLLNTSLFLSKRLCSLLVDN